MGLNKVLLIGYLGKDPEVTYTQSGIAVANFSLATSKSWKDKTTGEKQEKTEWHRIKAFNKQAETVGRYLQKGRQIYIEGEITYYQYEKDGVIKYGTDIIMNNFQFLGGGDSQQTPLQPDQNRVTPSPGFQQQQQQQGFVNQGNSQGFNHQQPKQQDRQRFNQQQPFNPNQPNNQINDDDIPF